MIKRVIDGVVYHAVKESRKIRGISGLTTGYGIYYAKDKKRIGFIFKSYGWWFALRGRQNSDKQARMLSGKLKTAIHDCVVYA